MNPIQRTNPIPSIRSMISRPFLRGSFCVVALAFAWIALSPQARAVCQQGCDIINANTFLGDNALSSATGSANTAVGASTLVSTSGSGNTAIGFFALQNNTTGFANTANGNSSLLNNTTGASNTASGSQTLFSNTTGDAQHSQRS